MKTILILIITAAAAIAGPMPELTQSSLERTERVNPEAVPYSNSIFIDPLQAGYLGTDQTKRWYRCGEIVHIIGTDRIGIVYDYRWDGHQWLYRIRGAHYKPKSLN